jgi:hypothetical protein
MFEPPVGLLITKLSIMVALAPPVAAIPAAAVPDVARPITL